MPLRRLCGRLRKFVLEIKPSACRYQATWAIVRKNHKLDSQGTNNTMTIYDDIKWFDEVLNKEFEEASDRAVVIVGTSILDEQLKDILTQFMIHDVKSVKNLIERSSFWSRIETSYCLGLISKEERNNLHTVRGIRNNFAHKLTGPTTFANQSVKDECSKINLPEEIISADLSARSRFQGAVKYLGMLLVIRSFQAEERRCKVPENLPPVLDFTKALLDALETSPSDKVTKEHGNATR